MRSGELFAGVGGLGMAVDDVFGSAPAWFCEFDAAPSKVLAYRHPDIPNYGDVTAVDWTTTPRVNILAGGFPCQDVSLAGRRRGMGEGTRSGLWSEYAKAIDEIRPDWVVIENVRGLLSADANSDMEPCTLCVGDNPGHVLRALGAVLGDLAELGFDAEWIGLRAADIGAPHGRFRVFILAWPTSNTRDATGHGQRAREESRQGDTAVGMTLLPTPVAQPSGNTPQDHLRKNPGREVVTDLAIIAENGLIRSAGRLLPTPRTTDMNGPGVHGSGGLDLRSSIALLPTPTVGNATGGNAQRGGERADEKLLPGIAVEVGQLMPTPRATRGGSATEMAYAMGGARSDDERPQGVVVPGADWGPYADAIARWETVIGRPAPPPVRMDGKGGKPRLNPELTEWMMGWPAGHVTDENDEQWRARLAHRRAGRDPRPVGMRGSIRRIEIGLTRAEQLKACGNGVVPQQAAAALRELLARPGVPRIEAA